MRALTISPFAAELLSGPRQSGVGLGHGYLLVGRQVMALTPPGRLRMPNGLDRRARRRRRQCAENGQRRGHGRANLGSRPHPRIALSLRPRAQLDLANLAGRGPGLTPLGDDILVGYLAAMALAGASGTAVAACAAPTGPTTALSRTLLRLAARGALPEAALEVAGFYASEAQREPRCALTGALQFSSGRRCVWRLR
jgi:hypothetical protein